MILENLRKKFLSNFFKEEDESRKHGHQEYGSMFSHKHEHEIEYVYIELIPFGYYMKCPKCECDELYSEYKPESNHDAIARALFGNPYTMCYKKICDRRPVKITEKRIPERITKKCAKCGYRWDEAVADGKECEYCKQKLIIDENRACAKCGVLYTLAKSTFEEK